MAGRSKGTGRTPREGAALLARRTEVFRRWRLGENPLAIGKALGMSRQLVFLDCKLALSEWQDTHRGAVAEIVAMELDLMYRLQLKLEQIFEDTEKKGAAEWRILTDGILKLSAARRQMLGIDRPTRIEAQTTAEVTVSSSFKTLDELRSDVRKRQKAIKARKSESKK